MCEKVVEEYSWQLYAVPDHFKMEKMCERVVEENPWCLKYVPAHLKTEKFVKEPLKKTHGS